MSLMPCTDDTLHADNALEENGGLSFRELFVETLEITYFRE